MAGKKGAPQLTKYCRIFQWVEAQDPAFAGALPDLCLEGLLSGGRGAGVTFLYPKDKAYRQEVVDKTYSDEADEAVKIVESLIIPDALPAAADFGKRAAVGSRLGVRYAVEASDGDKVRLAGGVELVPAEDFRTLARRAGDIAVWLVAKGRLPLAGEAYQAPPPERRGKQGGARRGGADGAPALTGRQLLAAGVEGDFDRCMRQDRCRSHDPYLGKVVSLLNFLRARNPDMLLKVMPVLDFDPTVCFYLLLEPYKTRGEYLIDEEVIFGPGGWNGADIYSEDAAVEYRAFFAAIPAQQGMTATDGQTGAPAIPFVFRDHAAVAAQVDITRQQVNAKTPRDMAKVVQDAYVTLATANTIQGMGPILPDSTHRALPGSKKLWQDEVRFIVYEALQTMRSGPYDTAVFAGIVRDLRFRWPGNDYGAELCLTNPADIQTSVGPRQELIMLTKFVNSTDFFYMPAAPSAVGGAWGSMDPTDWAVYNRSASAAANLGRVAGMKRPDGISPQALLELQVYAQLHGGQLPPAVQAIGRA